MTGQSHSIVSVVGARPQFVKLAPIARAFDAIASVQHRVIHTGQHYDEPMSKVFFDQLELPMPEVNLGIGSASHGKQTGDMLSALEALLQRDHPQAVLVYGDTNSTLAATLAAVKLQLPVFHIEAGLRSFNRAMPEEINRCATDHCCDRLYAPTPVALRNLEAENLGSRAVLSGDVMRDAMSHYRPVAAQKSRVLDELQVTAGDYALLTLHRQSNTTASVLQALLSAVATLANDFMPVVFPAHPRLRTLLNDLEASAITGIQLTEPLPYLDMIRLVESASVVMTDSGGVQKEAAFLGTPCITLRTETEWQELVDLGVNQLVGHDTQQLRDAFAAALGTSRFDANCQLELDRHYGNGNAATLISQDIVSWLNDHQHAITMQRSEPN